jgi:hypothetical protein
MFCIIYQWMISWFLDSGKPFSRLLSRHLRRCEDCREFARASGALDARLSHETPGIPRESHEALEARIISSLTRKLPQRVSSQPRFTFKPLPAFVVALLVIAVAMGIMFRVIPLTSPPGTGSSLGELTEARVIKMPLEGLASGVESPMESEIHSLGQSLSSATEFLVSCLDVKIGQ